MLARRLANVKEQGWFVKKINANVTRSGTRRAKHPVVRITHFNVRYWNENLLFNSQRSVVALPTKAKHARSRKTAWTICAVWTNDVAVSNPTLLAMDFAVRWMHSFVFELVRTERRKRIHLSFRQELECSLYQFQWMLVELLHQLAMRMSFRLRTAWRQQRMPYVVMLLR